MSVRFKWVALALTLLFLSSFVSANLWGFLFRPRPVFFEREIAVTSSARISYEERFTDADLSIVGVLDVNHALDTNRVIAKVYDNVQEVILPDKVEVVDANLVRIDLNSFGDIAGTWRALIVSANLDRNANTVVDFDNSDLDDNSMTVSHDLDKKYVQIKVANDLDQVILPDEVTYLSENDLNISLTSFVPIAGTWRAIVSR